MSKIIARLRDGRTVIGHVACHTDRTLWIRLQRVTGYWPVIPDPDNLFPVSRERSAS